MSLLLPGTIFWEMPCPSPFQVVSYMLPPSARMSCSSFAASAYGQTLS